MLRFVVLSTIASFLAGPPPTAPGARRPRRDTIAAPDTPASPNAVLDALAPEPNGLTADAVAAAAVAVSPEVEVQNAAIMAAAARVDETIATFLPQMELSARYTRLSDVDVRFGEGALVGALNPGPLGVGPCPGGTGQCVVDAAGAPVGATSFIIPQVLDNFSTQASISIPVSDYVYRAFVGLKASKLNRQAAELQKQARILKVTADSKLAYYNWLRAKAGVVVARDAVTTATARLQEATVSFEAGVLARADYLRVQALVAQAQTAQVDAEAFESVTRRNIEVIMAQKLEHTSIGEDLLAPVAAPEQELSALVEEGLAQRLELQSLDRNVEALRRGIATERAAYAPRLDLFGEVIYANPNPRYFPPTDEWNATWAAGAALSWNLTRVIATAPRIKTLKSQAREMRAQQEALRRGVELEVTQAYADAKRAVAAAAFAETRREAAQAAYDATSVAFRVGTATATDLVTAQSEQINAQLQAINARIDMRVAKIKLAYATGNLTAPT